MLDTTSPVLSEGGPAPFGDRNLCDWEAFSPGTAFSEPTSADTTRAVKKRQDEASPDYHKAAKHLDGGLCTPAGSTGSAESEVNTHDLEKIAGLVAGVYGEMPRVV